MPEQMTKKDAIETLEIFRNDYTREGSAMCRAIDIAIDALRQQPELRHGRWKKKNGEIYCTNCKKCKWSESFELMLRRFNFCPKCGADMRKEGADNG